MPPRLKLERRLRTPGNLLYATRTVTLPSSLDRAEISGRPLVNNVCGLKCVGGGRAESKRHATALSSLETLVGLYEF